MSLTFDFKAFNRVANSLRAFSARFPEVTDKAMGEWAKETRAGLKSTPYPPPPENTEYVRSGRLANSWYAKRLRPREWQVGNSAFYAPYVVGDETGRQAYEYEEEGRFAHWWKAVDKINEKVPALRRKLQATWAREIKAAGL